MAHTPDRLSSIHVIQYGADVIPVDTVQGGGGGVKGGVAKQETTAAGGVAVNVHEDFQTVCWVLIIPAAPLTVNTKQ